MEKTICFFIVIILSLDCRGIAGDAAKDIKTLPTRSKRVRRVFGFAKGCVRHKVKLCRTFTINGITKRICIIGHRNKCTSVDR